MNEVEQKPLTKHIQTAVTALEKQIEKYQNQILKQRKNAREASDAADILTEMVKGLQDQISKLKGESV